MKPTAQRARAPAQIEQIQLAVVVENDSVFQSRFDQRPGAQLGAVQFGIDVAQRLHLHFQSESDFQCAFTRARPLQFDFVGVAIAPA